MADSLLGRVIWYELMTTDMKAAETFYGEVVGWSVAPFEGSSHPYDVWMRTADQAVGGVMTIPEGMHFPPHWGMYIGTPNLEETVAAVESRGGKSLSPVIELPQVGRMRTMTDPQGAAFSLLQPAPSGVPEDREPEIGETSWHELWTTDAEAAQSFYNDLFGWTPTEALDMGPMGKYYMFARGKHFGGGMMNKTPDMAQVPTHWAFYFRVPDVHAAAERIKSIGGRVVNGPMEVPGGDWVVNGVDPQGAHFALHHKK